MDCLHWHMPAFTAGWSPSLSLEMSSWTSLINCKLKPNTLHETNILRPWTYAILKRKEVVIFQAIEKSSGKFLVAGHLLTPAVLSLTLPQFEIQRSKEFCFVRCPERCHEPLYYFTECYTASIYITSLFVIQMVHLVSFMTHWIHGADLLSIVSASCFLTVVELKWQTDLTKNFSSRIVCNSFSFHTRLTKTPWR